MDTISKNDIANILFDEQFATITGNELIAEKIYKMTLKCDTSKIDRSGRFINILLEGFYLRRPISISDYDKNGITIIYRVVGNGTDKLSKLVAGMILNILIPLGNGYNIDEVEGKRILLVGGGIGVPPLLKLAKDLKSKGFTVTVVMGYNNKNEIFYEKEFGDVADSVKITTVDGSNGSRGFVTDAFYPEDYDYFFACGPEPMLRALLKTGMKGQLSFEARMGCGFGACMGCTCQTTVGNKRICLDGPIFKSEEIL